MKKRIALGSLSLLSFSNLSFGLDNASAFKRAYQQGLIASESTAQASVSISRAQFAPMLQTFIEKVALKDYTENTCKARDIEKADTEYQTALTKLCSYGLLNGEKGSLYPLWKLTNGQAVALIMRVIDGTQNENTAGGKHRAQNYFDRAVALNIPVGHLASSKNTAISYENLVNVLYTAKEQTTSKKTATTIQNSTISSTSSKEDPLKQLAEIMEK